MNPRRSQLVCRTCLKVINEKESYTAADANTEYGKIIDILETCVSELNLDLTNDVVLCNNCTIMLRISYNFKLKCLHTEDTVFGYLQNNNLPLYNKINLTDMLNSLTNVKSQSSNQQHVGEKLSNDKYFPCRNERPDAVACNHLSSGQELYTFRNEHSVENSGVMTHDKIKKNEEINNANNMDVLMFENVSKSEDSDIDCVNNPITEKVTPEGSSVDQLFIQGNSDLEVQKRCRLNSCKEEYSESLFRFCGEEDEFENFIFKPPSM